MKNVPFKLAYIVSIIAANVLWINTLYDISQFGQVRPDFAFPSFFLPLFGLGTLLAVACSIGASRIISKSTASDLTSGKMDVALWIAIPFSVLCTAPVCYDGNIFLAPYLSSSVIRIGLLVGPLVLMGLYFLRRRQRTALAGLLVCSLVLLCPNDQCYNAFNYRWIERVGASPLTYLPTMFVILFVIAGLFSKQKVIAAIVVYGMSLAALFVAIGHRTRFLW